MSAGRPAISHLAGEIHSLGLTDHIGQVGKYSQTFPIKLQGSERLPSKTLLARSHSLKMCRADWK
jgi:hypothetical protein